MVAEIEDTTTGEMILSFADVFASLGGPLDELVKEIKNLHSGLVTGL